MNKKQQNNHTIDMVFVITLFFVFSLSALMLVIIGADVYKKTVASMDSNYISRTSFAYVTEKIRQNDSYDSIEIKPYGEGDALLLKETIEDTSYTTYLYIYNGYLMELFAKSDQDLSPDSGQKILAIQSFSIKKINNSLYEFTFQNKDDENTTLLLGSHCG